MADQVFPIVTPDDVSLELGITPTDAQLSIIKAALVKGLGAIRRYIHYDPVLSQRTEFHPTMPLQAQISRGIWEVMEQRAVLRQVAEAATNELQLQCIPVRDHGPDTLQVWVDYDGRSGAWPNSFRDETKKREGADFWANYTIYDSQGMRVSLDGVLRTIGLWPTTAGTVKCSYYAGYTTEEFLGTATDENGAMPLDATPIFDTLLVEAVRRVRRILAQRSGRLGVMAGINTTESLGDYSYTADSKSIERLMGSDLLPESVQRLSSFVNWGSALIS
jgi:hypothetical protein